MINPLTIIKSLKDLPDPVNVQFESPTQNILPKELEENNSLIVSQLWIDNLSKSVLENLRIKILAPLIYDPVIRTKNKYTEIDYKFDKEKNEIHILRFDPKESLRISFFPEHQTMKDFACPQIIINNKELSGLATQLGFYYKYPSLARAYFFAFISALLVLASMFYLVYQSPWFNRTFLPSSNYSKLLSAKERMEKFSCPMSIEKNSDKLQIKLLNSSTSAISATLVVNDVKSMEEFSKKEEVFILNCK